MIKDVMENIVKTEAPALSKEQAEVPFVVDVSTGKNWGEMRKIVKRKAKNAKPQFKI